MAVRSRPRLIHSDYLDARVRELMFCRQFGSTALFLMVSALSLDGICVDDCCRLTKKSTVQAGPRRNCGVVRLKPSRQTRRKAAGSNDAGSEPGLWLWPIRTPYRNEDALAPTPKSSDGEHNRTPCKPSPIASPSPAQASVPISTASPAFGVAQLT